MTRRIRIRRHRYVRGMAMGLSTSLLLAGTLTQAAAEPVAPELDIEPAPYSMDTSNQAGWWHPLAEYDGSTYMVFNAPAATENRHQVHVARRDPSGEWTTGCLQTSDGACAEYVDDIGHNQPSLAIDGDGYLHAFVSMHNDGWRYFRSEEPGSVTTIVDHAADLPDQEGGVTYPVTATAPRSGDVYLMARVSMPGVGHTGRLYRWSVDERTWQREAVFTPGHVETGYVPYPDDLEIDDRGHVHILWEWARGSTSNLRYYGSYLVYRPAEDRFVGIDGRDVEIPVSPADQEILYEPEGGVVQSARLALINHTPNLAGIAYRYQPPGEASFEVRWAAWDGQQWVRETVDAGGFNSYAAIEVTHHRATARIYYIKHPSCEPEQVTRGTVFVAEKQVTVSSDDGAADWQPRLLGGAPGTERLAATTRTDGTDVLYLAAPRLENPTQDPALYLATLSRTASAVPLEPVSTDQVHAASADGGTDPATGRKNWAFGAPVSVSSALNETSGGECAVDGNSWADYSRWMSSRSDPEPTLTMAFEQPIQVDEVRVYSGYKGGTTDALEDFAIDVLVAGEWREVAQVSGNVANPAVVRVDDLAFTGELRLRALNLQHVNHLARIYEVEVYSRDDAPALDMSLSANPPYLLFAGDSTDVELTLANRSGEPVSGTVEFQAPEGWTFEPAEGSYDLAPNETTSIPGTVTSATGAAAETFQIVARAPAHDVEATLSLPVRDGIVYSGDGAPHYTEAGPWAASGLVGHAGSTTRYTQGGTGASATWTPELPQAGRYQVYAWYPAAATNTTEAQFTVRHAGGTAQLVVDQQQTANTWHLLGEWEFDAGSAGSVTLTSVAAGHHRANAVRFQPQGSGQPELEGHDDAE